MFSYIWTSAWLRNILWCIQKLFLHYTTLSATSKNVLDQQLLIIWKKYFQCLFCYVVWKCKYGKYYLLGTRINVLRMVTTRITVFWDVTPCSMVEIHSRLGGTYYLHHQIRRMAFLFLSSTLRRCVGKYVIRLVGVELRKTVIFWHRCENLKSCTKWLIFSMLFVCNIFLVKLRNMGKATRIWGITLL